MSKGVALSQLRAVCADHANVHRHVEFGRNDADMAKWCGASVRMVMRKGGGLMSYSQTKRRLDALVEDGLALKVWGGPGSIAFYWPAGLAEQISLPS